jgi:hypothetical protein
MKFKNIYHYYKINNGNIKKSLLIMILHIASLISENNKSRNINLVVISVFLKKKHKFF